MAIGCDHEQHRLAKLLRTEPLERFDADSIGGHYEVVWCEKCGAIKRGEDAWQAPTEIGIRVVSTNDSTGEIEVWSGDPPHAHAFTPTSTVEALRAELAETRQRLEFARSAAGH
jgi:hypothetical protein